MSAPSDLSEEVLHSPSALDNALAEWIDAGRTGIALRAPSSILASVMAQRGLMVAGCRVETLRDAARWPRFERMALLVAAQIESGKVRCGHAFPDPAQGFLPLRPPDPGRGFTGSVFHVNVSARLRLPPVPGPIALWLIARDRKAGPVHVVVANPSQSGIEDPEVAKFVSVWRKRHIVKPRGADPDSVWPPETVFGTYPVYRRKADSPPMPERGISLVAQPSVVLDKSAAWSLSGSFSVTVPWSQVVSETYSGDPTTAVVPITLIVTRNDMAGPAVVHLRVPSYLPTKTRDNSAVAEGQFKLNLFRFPGMWRTPGTCFIHALSGDSISSPAVSELSQYT